MKKGSIALSMILSLLLAGACQDSKKTAAEETYDAASNARKRAEKIKAEQDKKAKDADAAADP